MSKNQSIDEHFISTHATFLANHSISFADATIECLYSIMDPEAPGINDVAEKFAENREVKFKNDDEKALFISHWKEMNTELLSHLNSLKADDAIFAEKCKTIASSIATEAFRHSRAAGFSELIIGSMDLIVFVYSRFYELKPMICELFQYEGEDNADEFIKIIENTCLSFAQECRETDDDKVEDEYFKRVYLFFTQAMLLCGIALLGRKNREGTQ